MSYVNRKHRRVELDYMARIIGVAGEPICDCALMDVSDAGARLAVLAVDMVPDEFVLRMSATSNVIRQCKVVWRKDDEIGITYLKPGDVQKLAKAARRAKLLENPCP